MELVVALILTCCGTCLGQLLARIYYLKNSSSKSWLLIPPLSVPPLSIIPTTMMAFGLIDEGNGDKPYDYYVLLPLFTTLVMPFVMKKVSSSGVINFTFSILVGFISTYTAFYFRDYSNCTTESNVMIKTVLTMLAVAMAEYLLSYIPLSGTMMKLISKMNGNLYKIMKTGVQLSVMFSMYIIMNMVFTTKCTNKN